MEIMNVYSYSPKLAPAARQNSCPTQSEYKQEARYRSIDVARRGRSSVYCVSPDLSTRLLSPYASHDTSVITPPFGRDRWRNRALP